MPTFEHIAKPKPPWAELVVLAPGQTLDDFGAALPDFAVRQLDGGRCATKRGLLSALARAFDFPSHFGQNWDALEDCLTDLEWLPAAGYLLVIADADRLLAGHEEDYRTFVAILETAGAEWATPRSGVAARPPRPFHTLLTVPAPRVGVREDWHVPVRHTPRTP